MRTTVGLALLAMLSLGCPPDDKRTPPPASKGACASVGQSCEVSPGKLGTCVQNDDCKSGSPCFSCQSQH